MTATKQKVSELPKEQQDAIFKKLTDLKIRGASGYLMWTVETAQKKIADALALKNADSGQSGDNANSADNAGGDNGAGATEQSDTGNNGKTSDGENKSAAPANESAKKEAKKEPEKVLLCHICRSRVVKGKCTGCGFELRV